MNRSSVNFTRMAWLALLAMLLAALMPTASRVIASATADEATPALHEMCTMGGAKLIDASPLPVHGKSDSGIPMSQAMGDACGYCVLAMPLPLLLVLLAAWTLLPQAVSATLPASARLKPSRNIRGLGSQAPPVAL